MSQKTQRMPRPSVVTPQQDEFVAAVIAGLSLPQKSLPCRYFYDARGSDLFEEITSLPEYYPTRAETEILQRHATQLAESVPEGCVLVEFGSGSSRKTEILLAALPGLRAYVPIDVSRSALDDAAYRLRRRFPSLDVQPVEADFSGPIDLPIDLADGPRVGFFPGSTIGNLTRREASLLLHRMRLSLSPGGNLIVGVDLKKDARRLVLAYNDSSGVTAAFNLNLLARINREIEPAFDLDKFRHQSIYNPVEGRIEMHLVSVCEQTMSLRGHRIHFRAGETIHTENSHKYSIPEFQALVRASGWTPQTVWTDVENLFSVHLLKAQ